MILDDKLREAMCKVLVQELVPSKAINILAYSQVTAEFLKALKRLDELELSKKAHAIINDNSKKTVASIITALDALFEETEQDLNDEQDTIVYNLDYEDPNPIALHLVLALGLAIEIVQGIKAVYNRLYAEVRD